MLPNNVRISSARYANAENTLVFVLLDNGDNWYVPPNNGSGQANVLAEWIANGGNIGPFVPPVPGAIIPVGALIWSSSKLVPQGYLFCDGSAVKRLQYPTLFSVIGTTFGSGDNQSTFNLPDLSGQIIRGWGPVNALDPDREFGSKQQNLLGSHHHPIVGAHTHGVIDPGHLHAVDDPGHFHLPTDPGHSHSSTDPGHRHVVDMREISYVGAAVTGDDLVVTPDPNYTPNFTDFVPYVDPVNANLSVNQTSANLSIAAADANVGDLVSFTKIAVNPALTNVTQTELEGGFRTVPANLTLLPYIRY